MGRHPTPTNTARDNDLLALLTWGDITTSTTSFKPIIVMMKWWQYDPTAADLHGIKAAADLGSGVRFPHRQGSVDMQYKKRERPPLARLHWHSWKSSTSDDCSLKAWSTLHAKAEAKAEQPGSGRNRGHTHYRELQASLRQQHNRWLRALWPPDPTADGKMGAPSSPATCSTGFSSWLAIIVTTHPKAGSLRFLGRWFERGNR